MPKTQSDDFLLKYSEEHVAYEVRMFIWLANALGKRTMTVRAKTEEDALRLRFALIEAFVLHLRNLREFLFLNYPKNEHIVAAQFCQMDIWQKARPALSAVLKTAWGRASKEMAHLTTKRIAGSPREKEWDFTGLADEIRPIIRLLAATAERSRLSPFVAMSIMAMRKVPKWRRGQNKRNKSH